MLGDVVQSLSITGSLFIQHTDPLLSAPSETQVEPSAAGDSHLLCLCHTRK